MDFLINLLSGFELGSLLFYLSLTAFFGGLLGKLEIKGVKLGVAGVLFVGLFLSYIKCTYFSGPEVSEGYAEMLHFAKDFGLILFVYSVGIESGPRFFSAFKDEGIKLNLLALGIVLTGVAIAFAIKFIDPTITSDQVVGVLCGAVTNTPSMSSATQALTEAGASSASLEIVGSAYAIAYPFGVLGLILAIILIKVVFRISTEKEEESYEHEVEAAFSTKLESVEITVTNANLFGTKFQTLKKLTEKILVVSRILRNDTFFVPGNEDVIEAGDVLYGVSSSENIEDLRVQIGTVEIGDKRAVEGDLGMEDILVTNRAIAGKSIEQIGVYRRYEARITRVFRAGREILPNRTTKIDLGDTIRVVGKKALLADVRKEIGNSVKQLAKPNTIPIFIGIFLGVVLGSIPIFIPGMSAPAKLGLAGGPLIVAILLGHKGRIGKMDFYMTAGANYMIRDIGITLFLACVGLSSGLKFADAISNHMIWMAYGAAITFIPVFVFGVVARIMKINYLKISGMLAGSMTDPPVLDYANSMAPTQAQGTAYATVYPLTMFMRILTAQILVLVTL